MSTLDVVADILREVAPRALKSREIARLAIGRLPSTSKTPETVISRDLAIDVKRHGTASRFLRADRGAFLLKEAVPTAFYNEFEPYAAQWTRNLIAAGEIAAGVVDERSIRDLKPSDVASYRQFHAFSGIGVWSRALRDAGVPDDANVWSGSCPCFPAGTLVLTQRGNISIEDVQAGDNVLTHRGRWRRVQHTGSEIGTCVMLKGQGHWGLVCTPEHPFLSGAEEWTPADQMAGKRWATVAQVPFFMSVPPLGVYQTREEAQAAREAATRAGRIDVRGADAVDTSSLAFATFLGYWIGDGWTSGASVFICGAKSDEEFLRNLMGSAGLSCWVGQERTSARATCGSKTLVAWLRQHFGHGAAHKRIPAWLHGASTEYRQAFLSGYFAADGHRSNNGRSGAPVLVFTTVSRALAVGTRILLNQAGISASIGRTHSRGGKTCIEGRVVNELPMYQVSAYDKARSFYFDGVHGRGLVRTVTAAGTARVYNLSVEEDESYSADGIVVHNCQGWSSAGKRLGFADVRHLWPEWFRLIAACRPSWVVGEQVASKDGLAWVDAVRNDLEGANYTFQIFDLPAAGLGAPHKRQRFYFVAHARERGREILRAPWLHDRGQRGDDAARRCSTHVGDALVVSDAAGARPRVPEDVGADCSDARESPAAIEWRTSGDLEPQRGGDAHAARAVPDADRDGWAGREREPHGWEAIEPDRHGQADGAGNSFDMGDPSGPRPQGGVSGARGESWASGSSEADGAGCGCLGAVELGDASRSRGGRDSGALPRAQEAGAGERIEARYLADEPLAPSADDGGADVARVGDDGDDGGGDDDDADAESRALVRGATLAAGNGAAAHGFRPGDRIRIAGDPGWRGSVRGVWAVDVEWIYCRPEPGHKDGRWRPAESCTQPLASWTSEGLGRTRAKRLRGYGNAIVLPLATAFVESVLEAFLDAAIAAGISPTLKTVAAEDPAAIGVVADSAALDVAVAEQSHASVVPAERAS